MTASAPPSPPQDDDTAEEQDGISGTVTYYDAARGYGYITWDGQGTTPHAVEFFFHISQVEASEIAEGDSVLFYEGYDLVKERMIATEIVFSE